MSKITRAKILGHLKPGSAEYVIAHRKITQRKGRNPSAIFCGSDGMIYHGHEALKKATITLHKRQSEAFRHFEKLSVHPYPAIILRIMHKEMKAEGINYDFFDIDGTKTAHQMKCNVNSRAVASFLREARIIYNKLETHPHPNSLVNLLNIYLEEAGKDFSDLDPTGNSTNRAMQAEVIRRAKAAGEENPKLTPKAQTTFDAGLYTYERYFANTGTNNSSHNSRIRAPGHTMLELVL